MLKLYKYALGPILLAQSRRLRRSALRLPEAAGPRSGSIPGSDVTTPVRLLFVGDSSAAGVGVDDQRQALAAQAASFLAARLDATVEWQLLARSGVTTQQALGLLEHAPPAPADILVTSLGTNDVTSQRTQRQFLSNYARLVSRVRDLSGVRGVVVTGLPPLRILPAAPHPLRWYLGRYAARLDKALQHWVGGHTDFRYVSLEWAAVPDAMARDRFHPGREQYRHWAQLVAASVADLLHAARPAPKPAQ